MLFAPVFGYLGDWYSRKYLMAAGVFLWSVLTFLSSLISGHPRNQGKGWAHPEFLLFLNPQLSRHGWNWGGQLLHYNPDSWFPTCLWATWGARCSPCSTLPSPWAAGSATLWAARLPRQWAVGAEGKTRPRRRRRSSDGSPYLMGLLSDEFISVMIPNSPCKEDQQQIPMKSNVTQEGLEREDSLVAAFSLQRIKQVNASTQRNCSLLCSSRSSPTLALRCLGHPFPGERHIHSER